MIYYNMKKVAIGLYGAGGFGREVAALLPSIFSKLFPNLSDLNILLLFIDDNRNLIEVDEIKVVSWDDFLNLAGYELYSCVTVSDCKTRRSIVIKLRTFNVKPLTLIFNETLIMDKVRIGMGSIVMPGSKISTSVIIRDYVHINFNTYIAHDCVINNFATISPGVVCCGNTIIGECAFIGAGCKIKQGNSNKPRVIGAESVLGIGSVLISDLPDQQIYVGNPARSINH